MKLRNKKTGEIVDTLCSDDITKGISFGIDHHNGNPTMAYYNSLTELNAEWEDAPEEPKEHWAIDQFGEPINVSGLSRLQLEKLHRLGNDFPSENATMKALEKLKAFERLKDKGFRFTDWGYYHLDDDTDISISARVKNDKIHEDLEKLFGGGE